ncbi:FecR family protein [Xanthovirga aplysinae]|uniref:FecR family protein n=1 Tax=Xanthovirga aplysinae TaxID=2529853 RepID=UPI0012BBB9CC|nr:FecR domain-containing protein [Xanthovirga aplysinae]MTI32765.1 DUF4974 domain-containing protein [Xanthovirga aplysinae]
MENFDKKIQNKLSSYRSEETPSDASVEKMLSKLDQVLPKEDKVKPISTLKEKKSSLGLIYKLVASVTIFFLMFYTTYRWNEMSVVVGNAAHKVWILPDGSKVKINAGSELRYNKLLWVFERKVTLTGEAFFEVKKGEKFVVDSELGTTQVLGTSFNIFARVKSYEVRCSTGSVRVTSKSTNDQVLLKPGEGVTFKTQSLQPFEFDVANDKDWRKGAFFFDETIFESVIAELERQYNVEISYPKDYANLLYSGYFDNQNLAKALKLVCEPVGLEYQQKGKKIKFTALE